MSDIITEKLIKVRNVLDINKYLTQEITVNDIKKYYKTNRLAYYLFHNSIGFVHMGISSNGKYHYSDLYHQADIVSDFFNDNTQSVLELAPGKSANLKHLAKSFPTIKFYGLDLSQGQTKEFKTKNIICQHGDYHDLSMYPNSYFDVIYIIEGLCHTNKKLDVAKQVKSKLKPNGYFIVFDGYISPKPLSDNQTIAKKLIEQGMMVNNFETFESVNSQILKAGFIQKKYKDFSVNIIPNLEKFEKLASRVFNHTSIGKFIFKVLPDEFTRNSLAGYLMLDFIRLGLANYALSVYVDEDF